MTKPRRKRTRETPDVRRRQLLDAAQDLIMAHGPDALTMAAVAERAGVGKGTVYLYFDAKATLIEAMQARYWDGLLHVAQTSLERETESWLDRLDQMLDDLFAFGVHEDALFHRLFPSIPTVDIAPLQELASTFAEVLDQGQRAGEFRLLDTEMTADVLVSAYHGVAPRIIHAAPGRRRREADLLKRLFHRLLGVS